MSRGYALRVIRAISGGNNDGRPMDVVVYSGPMIEVIHCINDPNFRLFVLVYYHSYRISNCYGFPLTFIFSETGLFE